MKDNIKLPPLPDNDAIEEAIYAHAQVFIPLAAYDAIRHMMQEYSIDAIKADRKRICDPVTYGPFNVTFMGPGVWAGIPDELPPELVGKQVYVSIAPQSVVTEPKFGEEQ